MEFTTELSLFKRQAIDSLYLLAMNSNNDDIKEEYMSIYRFIISSQKKKNRFFSEIFNSDIWD